jgi:hypothetical protein
MSKVVHAEHALPAAGSRGRYVSTNADHSGTRSWCSTAPVGQLVLSLMSAPLPTAR